MTRSRALLFGLIGLVFAGLVALGVWQLERRTWKLALIEQTERLLKSPPVPAPPPLAWARIGPDDTYRPVFASGRFATGADTYVQAATTLGGGFWVVTPFRTGGFTVLVNRGFVPPELRGRAPAPPAGETTVRGLLRQSEPGGGFLRSNNPANDRWYSRDTAAIATARGVDRVAPYFIDQGATPGAAWPRGGLTVVTFRNTHLVYALTWFALAGLLAFMTWRVARRAGQD